MCSPLAQARNSFGLALLTFITKWKSCICTLPAPPPPPAQMVPALVSPQENDMIWISSLCVLVLALAGNRLRSSGNNQLKPLKFLLLNFRISRPGGERTRRSPRLQRSGIYPRADGGSSATSRIDTVSSSSWKCGRRNATARYTPGLPGNLRNVHARLAQRVLRLGRAGWRCRPRSRTA